MRPHKPVAIQVDHVVGIFHKCPSTGWPNPPNSPRNEMRLPLKAIAAACGYRTANALRTAYRKRFKAPPTNGNTVPMRECVT